MTTSLSGKRALVCGGSQGIGRACGLALAQAGASVTLLARNEETLRRAVAALPAGDGRTHEYLVADSDDPPGLQRTVADRIESHGAFEILINNSGGPPSGPIVDASGEAFAAAIQRHVIGNQLLAQTVLPGMKTAGYGRIVNIISTSVVAPIAGLGVSNTTRGAVANWGRTWAAELAPLGITVNNVLPGYTDTDRLGSLFDKKAQRLGTSSEQVRADTIAAIPMKRLADPAEIGAVVAFLASPAASYVTGVNLPVDGGRTGIQ
ncbi:MAG: SDR family oxidoreductase [Phycisphaerae bacterium]